MLMEKLVFLCISLLLATACQQRETPQWAPNVERTDITPSEWMVGCFAIDPMTEILRAAGAREQIDLTARRVEVIHGRQWYRVKVILRLRFPREWLSISSFLDVTQPPRYTLIPLDVVGVSVNGRASIAAAVKLIGLDDVLDLLIHQPRF